ncbi:MAG: mono/diheme cytochrome c family protein [Salibacteraceae bacterium]|jgi:mono/diheme cytochrome c family protein
MKNVNIGMYKSLITRSLSIVFLFFFALNLAFAQGERTPELDQGMQLFKNNCGSCHAKNMKAKMTGPALAGAEERWENDKGRLYQWIRNSQAFIATGDAYANNLYQEYGGSVMTAFPNLTDGEIDNILGYINAVATTGAYPPKVGGGPTGNEGDVASTGGGSNTLMYGVLALILAILSMVLARIVANLNHMQKVKAGLAAPARQTMWQIVTGSSVVGFLIFAFVIWGGYQTVNNAIDLGRTQGYAPTQPIKFSHETHAGLHKVDCQYCHDGARRSKHSVIPATNTCMNCHKAIEKGSEYGTAELTKIFASIGYNPEDNSYIEDYDKMSEAEIKKIYTKWIADNYMEDTNDGKAEEDKLTKLDEDGEELVAEQWQGILTALTYQDGEGMGLDDKIQGPINWTRIHNLPDHVYFNHAQHVTVGKQECQTCHGPVEEMKLLAQYAPLSMGWCVNCHRETKVDFKDNAYYASFKNMHQEMKEGKRAAVTVEDIGGIECQKCHY